MVPVGFFSWENHHVDSSENGGPSLDFLRSGAQNQTSSRRRKITQQIQGGSSLSSRLQRCTAESFGTCGPYPNEHMRASNSILDGWMDESLHVYIYILYIIYVLCRCRCRYTYVMYVYHRISYIHIITSRPPPGRQALNRAPPSTLTSTWVCLKIVYPNQPNGFADHYPY